MKCACVCGSQDVLSVTWLYLMVVTSDQIHMIRMGSIQTAFTVLILALRHFLSQVFPVTGYKWHVPYATQLLGSKLRFQYACLSSCAFDHVIPSSLVRQNREDVLSCMLYCMVVNSDRYDMTWECSDSILHAASSQVFPLLDNSCNLIQMVCTLCNFSCSLSLTGDFPQYIQEHVCLLQCCEFDHVKCINSTTTVV